MLGSYAAPERLMGESLDAAPTRTRGRHCVSIAGWYGRMAAMRVYLGSDHGGYELKQFIIEHLRQGEHEPIDCGAYTYDAEDDYPVFCIAAAMKTVADPGSLGIVLGGSGNGEQVAANKVPGARCCAGVGHGDGVAGPPAQQRPTDRHRRPVAHRRGGPGDRRCVRVDAVVGSASAINGVSTSSTTTNEPVSRRRFPVRRPDVPEIPAVDGGAQPVIGVLAAATASSASSNG